MFLSLPRSSIPVLAEMSESSSLLGPFGAADAGARVLEVDQLFCWNDPDVAALVQILQPSELR